MMTSLLLQPISLKEQPTLCFSKKAKALPDTCKDVPSDARTCVSCTVVSQYDVIKRNSVESTLLQ